MLDLIDVWLDVVQNESGRRAYNDLHGTFLDQQE